MAGIINTTLSYLTSLLNVSHPILYHAIYNTVGVYLCTYVQINQGLQISNGVQCNLSNVVTCGTSCTVEPV